MIITSEQVRAARAMLRIDQSDLASMAGVSVETIKRLEAKEGPLRSKYETLHAIKSSLEIRGIEFLEDGEPAGPGGSGIRLLEDRDATLKRLIKEAASDIVESAMQHNSLSDPQFFQRGADHISEKLLHDLNFLLPRSIAKL